MWSMKTFLFFYVVCFSVDNCFSNNVWYSKPYNYIEYRSASIYRGSFFALSVQEKIDLCDRNFYIVVHLLKKQMLLKGIRSEIEYSSGYEIDKGERRRFPILVIHEKLKFKGKNLLETPEELFFKCVSEVKTKDNLDFPPKYNVMEYFTSSAYVPFATSIWLEDKALKEYSWLGLAIVAAERIPLEQNQLEEQYLKSRKRIKALKQESILYMKSVEEMIDFTAFSTKIKGKLCYSVVSAPIYTEAGIRQYEPQDYTKTQQILEDSVKPLQFSNNQPKENLPSGCLICQAETYDEDSQLNILMNLLLIPSFDDQISLYVAKEEKDHYLLSEYFIKVPLLMNIP